MTKTPSRILFILLTFSFAKKAYNLQCFSGYNIQSTAAPSFNNVTSISCPIGSTACSKVTTNLNGLGYAYGYSCIPACISITYSDANVSAKTYCCTSDNCNTANMKHISPLLVLFMVFILMPFVEF